MRHCLIQVFVTYTLKNSEIVRLCETLLSQQNIFCFPKSVCQSTVETSRGGEWGGSGRSWWQFNWFFNWWRSFCWSGYRKRCSVKSMIQRNMDLLSFVSKRWKRSGQSGIKIICRKNKELHFYLVWFKHGINFASLVVYCKCQFDYLVDMMFNSTPSALIDIYGKCLF